jgi:hypothetical protein
VPITAAGVSSDLVVLFFMITGAIELTSWRRFVEKFVAWGYPHYWPIVTYALKLLGGVLILVPVTRIVGLSLCAAISVAAIATIVINRDASEYKAIPVNLIVLALVLTAIVA